MSLHDSVLSLNFLTVNLSTASEPPISVDCLEHEAVVSILQDDGTLRKEERDARECTHRMMARSERKNGMHGNARTGYQHDEFSKLK